MSKHDELLSSNSSIMTSAQANKINEFSDRA